MKGAGGDVVAFSTEPFSDELVQAATPYRHFQSSEMFTVSYSPRSDKTLFSKLKAVESDYPYYGEVPLASGRDIHQGLAEGLVVEQRVLDRLELQVGDELKIGDTLFPIVDVALSEPDRPLGMWGVSPRIFLSYENLKATGLAGPDSYQERRIYIKLDRPEEAPEVAESLRQVAIPDQERVDTWQKPPVNMEKYVENFFTFLDMMAVLAIALGGLGMQSTLSAWLRSRRKTIAITRTFGTDARFVLLHYSLIVLAGVTIGYVMGLATAAFLLLRSGVHLSQMLPVQVAPTLDLGSSVESAVLCFLVSLSFAVWPLYEASQVRPGAILRDDNFSPSRLLRFVLSCLLIAALVGLLVFMIGNLKKALWIGVGLTLVACITGFCSFVFVKFLKSLRPKNLALRTALGAWRSPEARAELVVFILTTCLAILYTAIICEEALKQSWIEAMPPESPNLIFLDIQPEQVEEFKETVGVELDVYANLRVRVQKINGVDLDRSGKREYWQRDGRGKMDANPTLELPENDTLLKGSSLYPEVPGESVSIREDMAEALNVGLGDRLTFGIQGVPVEATITSVRKSSRAGFKPSFELLFPPSLVEGAPGNVFASVRLPAEDIGPMQSRIAKAYPAVVSMDISLAIRLVAERLMQMVGLVQYFLWSGILAGILILVSATWSARRRRARESAYYKVMGADILFLNRVIWLENLVLGFTCSALGVGIAILASQILCSWTLKVDFPHVTQAIAIMFFSPGIAVALLGWLVSREVVQTRPAPYLREG